MTGQHLYIYIHYTFTDRGVYQRENQRYIIFVFKLNLLTPWDGLHMPLNAAYRTNITPRSPSSAVASIHEVPMK